MAKSQSPQNVLHLEMIKPKTIAAGKDNFIASNGDEILAWGNNSGQKSEPPIIAGKFLDYSAGLNNSIYLTNDGRVLPESDKLTNDPSLYTNLARVISAEDRFFAIKQDGTLINLAAEIIETTGPWGRQSFKIPQEAKNLVDFKPGIGHFVALMADGSVFCWRTSAEITQIKIPAHMTEQYGIIRIAAGAYHSLALRADGKVFAWGDNKNGQTDIPAINKKVVDVAATDETSIALLEDGNLVVWGKPLKEQQLPQDVIELDAKYSQLIVKKRNGKIQVLQAEIPINYAYLYNAKSISGELILDNDGNVHPLLATTPEIPEAARTGIEQIQGRDVELGKYYDLVGSGPVIRFSSPAQPSLPPTGYENYSSPYATLLKPINLTVSKSGHLTLWGSTDLSPPTDLGRVTRAQCAMTHCAAIKTNGQVVAWGGNYNGQTNVPTSLTTALDISVGDSFTLAVDSEHKVIGWGGNAYTELNVPRFSRPIKQIEASQFTSMALDDLGNVYSWGGYSSAVISQDPINGEAGPIDSLQQYGALSPNGQVFLPNTYSQVLRTLEYELPIVSIATGGNLISVVDIAGRVDIRGGIRIPADLTELLETTY
ncbi:MAG TPA: hypothetical protein VIZ65_15090 [Cellvibrionaceae bacterium]